MLLHYLLAYKRMGRCGASTYCRSTNVCCLQVILCTNIAETSVTLPGVRYVVDTGFVKARAYSGKAAAECLQVVPVSQAQARQRAGRAGAVLLITCCHQHDPSNGWHASLQYLHAIHLLSCSVLDEGFMSYSLMCQECVSIQWCMPYSDTAAGRAGREAPGKAFRLFTEASFNQLAATTLPEIQRVNLATVALQLKALGFDDLLAFDFMDRPPTAALLRALETLYALGALDDSGMPLMCSLGSGPPPCTLLHTLLLCGQLLPIMCG